METRVNNRFQGKIVVVTGGASGIGAAAVRRMAAEGASVVIADRALAAAEALAAELTAAGHRTAAGEIDVAQEAGWVALMALTESRFGIPDVLVNSAGYAQPYRIAHEEPEDSYDRLYDVNVKPFYWCARHVIPRMIANGGGTMVNVCSVSAERPRPLNTWYGASKAAAVFSTRALALEYARQNIRICGVNPGPIDTPLLAGSLAGHGGANEQAAARARMMENLPLGRVGQPGEIAAAIAFLASDDASFIVGEVVNVDGGRAI